MGAPLSQAGRRDGLGRLDRAQRAAARDAPSAGGSRLLPPAARAGRAEGQLPAPSCLPGQAANAADARRIRHHRRTRIPAKDAACVRMLCCAPPYHSQFAAVDLCMQTVVNCPTPTSIVPLPLMVDRREV